MRTSTFLTIDLTQARYCRTLPATLEGNIMRNQILICLIASVVAISGGAASAQTADPTAMSADMIDRYAHASWTFPSTSEMEGLYPDSAIQHRVGGQATINCTLALDGTLTACDIVSETPPGYGFGEATANAFLHSCHVDPSTVKGGVQPGDHKKFIYKWTL